MSPGTLERILEQKRSFIAKQACRIEELEDLCARAADALDCHNLDCLHDDLIEELRKAAE